jgi:hypothetical protein
MDSPNSDYEYLSINEVSEFENLAYGPDPTADDDGDLWHWNHELEAAYQLSLSWPDDDPFFLGTRAAPPNVSGLAPQRAYAALQDWCRRRGCSDPATVDSRLNAVWRQVKTQWFLKFNAQPYTSFCMVHHLVTVCAGISYERLLEDPMSLRKGCTEANINKHEALPWLIHSPGRCTTFAIQMAESLKAIPELCFGFHDTGGHRLARCSKTGILLDTLLKGGPIVLQEGEMEIRDVGSHRQTLYYESGSTNFKTTDRLGNQISVSSADDIL